MNRVTNALRVLRRELERCIDDIGRGGVEGFQAEIFTVLDNAPPATAWEDEQWKELPCVTVLYKCDSDPYMKYLWKERWDVRQREIREINKPPTAHPPVARGG